MRVFLASRHAVVANRLQPGFGIQLIARNDFAEQLARASLVFVGVIQKQQYDSWPMFRLNLPGADPADAKIWKILRREVRVETVLRGVEPRS